jgi:hypothetical protein
MLNISVHLKNYRIPAWLCKGKLVNPMLRVNDFSGPFQGPLN